MNKSAEGCGAVDPRIRVGGEQRCLQAVARSKGSFTSPRHRARARGYYQRGGHRMGPRRAQGVHRGRWHHRPARRLDSRRWSTSPGAPRCPGLSFSYLEGLVGDIGSGYEVATYQQRGLAPSSTSCPVDVAQEVDDVRRVLDHLEWPRAWVVGHSWGGHLLFHFAVAHQHRLMGGLAVDPLGAVGDGGLAGFATEMRNRATEGAGARIDELDGLSGDGEPDDRVMRQHLALIWPGYFANPADAPAMPDISVNAAA